MLLKWLFLVILVWYAFRAAGNLIRALAGDRDTRQQVPPDSGFGHTTSTGPDSESVFNERDIEDAVYEDLDPS